MSISSEITRISNAKTAIAESIANKGVTVPDGTKIDGMATLIDSIETGGGGDTSETWVLNETVDTSTKFSSTIDFISNGNQYSKILVGGSSAPAPGGMSYGLYYDNTIVLMPDIAGLFIASNQVYRKVTFATAPAGDLLTWLEANGVKQATDTAVQPTKEVTVTSNGTTTITPDVPYDTIKQVDLTVRMSGTNTVSFEFVAPDNLLTISNDLLVSNGIDTVEKFKAVNSISIVIKNYSAAYLTGVIATNRSRTDSFASQFGVTCSTTYNNARYDLKYQGVYLEGSIPYQFNFAQSRSDVEGRTYIATLYLN